MKFSSTRIQREVIKQIASKLGISEREAQEVVELIANAVKPEVGKFVGRRSFLAGLAGVGTALAITPAMARTMITDEYVDIDGVRLALKDYADMFTSPAFASAVVEKPEYDPDHVYAWKPANNYKGWKRIDKGEAGVDDAEVIQKVLDSLTPNRTWKERVVLKGEFIVKQTLLIPSYCIFDAYQATFRLADNANVPLIKVDGAEHFEILGVKSDGNATNQNPPAGLHHIRVWNSKNFKIKDIFIENAPEWCLELMLCDHAYLENLHFYTTSTATDGLSIVDCYNITAKGIFGQTVDDLVSIHAKERGVQDIQIENINGISENSGLLGIYHESNDTNTIYPIKRIVVKDITGYTLNSASGHVIKIGSHISGAVFENITIEDFEISSAADGIRLALDYSGYTLCTIRRLTLKGKTYDTHMAIYLTDYGTLEKSEIDIIAEYVRANYTAFTFDGVVNHTKIKGYIENEADSSGQGVYLKQGSYNQISVHVKYANQAVILGATGYAVTRTKVVNCIIESTNYAPIEERGDSDYNVIAENIIPSGKSINTVGTNTVTRDNDAL